MLRPDELHDAMTQAAAGAGPAEPPVEQLLASARRRYRRKQLALPALAAASVVAIAVPFALAATSTPPAPRADTADTYANDPRIPDNGDLVQATGFLMAIGDAQPRLCAEPPVSGSSMGPCRPGVNLIGLDIDVADEGRITVQGILNGDSIEVTWQIEALPPTAEDPRPQPEVPCPAPPGGWPEGNVPYPSTGPDYEGWRAFLARHPKDVQDRVLQLPVDGGRGQVLTLLARDKQEQEAIGGELVELFGADRICTVISQVDPAQAEATQEAFLQLRDVQWRSAGSQYEEGYTRQVFVATVERITPSLLALADQYPDGAVQLDAFINTVDPGNGPPADLRDGHMGGLGFFDPLAPPSGPPPGTR